MRRFNETNTSRMRPSDVGRPRIDDAEWIIMHFVRGLNEGRTLTDIAKKGLSLYGWDCRPNREPRFVVKRRLSAATLYRRYSSLKAHIEAELANQKLWNPICGSRIPGRPCDFASASVPMRGRPRKVRRR
jgi:hypothetical protein